MDNKIIILLLIMGAFVSSGFAGITSVSLVPSHPEVKDDLNCSFVVDTAANYNITWYKNGIHENTWDTSVACSVGTCYTNASVPASATSIGDRWICYVSSGDNYNFSDYQKLTTFTTGDPYENAVYGTSNSNHTFYIQLPKTATVMHSSLSISDVGANAWYESPFSVSGLPITNSQGGNILAFNMTGTGAWEIITNTYGGTYNWYDYLHGYYWNGTVWEQDDNITKGLVTWYYRAFTRSRDVGFNITGAGAWNLVWGSGYNSITTYTWNGTEWEVYATKDNMALDPRPILGFNTTGDGNWTMFLGGYYPHPPGLPLTYRWNGTDWVVDESYGTGLPSDSFTTWGNIVCNQTGDGFCDALRYGETYEIAVYYNKSSGTWMYGDLDLVSPSYYVGIDRFPGYPSKSSYRAFNVTGEGLWNLLTPQSGGYKFYEWNYTVPHDPYLKINNTLVYNYTGTLVDKTIGNMTNAINEYLSKCSTATCDVPITLTSTGYIKMDVGHSILYSNGTLIAGIQIDNITTNWIDGNISLDIDVTHVNGDNCTFGGNSGAIVNNVSYINIADTLSQNGYVTCYTTDGFNDTKFINFTFVDGNLTQNATAVNTLTRQYLQKPFDYYNYGNYTYLSVTEYGDVSGAMNSEYENHTANSLMYSRSGGISGYSGLVPEQNFSNWIANNSSFVLASANNQSTLNEDYYNITLIPPDAYAKLHMSIYSSDLTNGWNEYVITTKFYNYTSSNYQTVIHEDVAPSSSCYTYISTPIRVHPDFIHNNIVMVKQYLTSVDGNNSTSASSDASWSCDGKSGGSITAGLISSYWMLAGEGYYTGNFSDNMTHSHFDFGWWGDWLNETEFFHSKHQNTTATSTLSTQYAYNQTHLDITNDLDIGLDKISVPSFYHKWDSNNLSAGLGGSFSSPTLAFNITGDGNWTLINGRYDYSTGFFEGYYWNSTQWVRDDTRIVGLGNYSGGSAHAAVAFNITGDGNWTLISSNFNYAIEGYYWNGTQWVRDDTRIAGLTGSGKQNSVITIAYNITSDNNWVLLVGTYNDLDEYYWNGTQWVHDIPRSADFDTLDYGVDRTWGLQAAPTVGFNITGNNKWDVVIGVRDYYNGALYGYHFDGKWIKDYTIADGKNIYYPSLIPALAFNVTGDGEWALLTGDYNGGVHGYYYNNSYDYFSRYIYAIENSTIILPNYRHNYFSGDWLTNYTKVGETIQNTTAISTLSTQYLQNNTDLYINETFGINWTNIANTEQCDVNTSSFNVTANGLAQKVTTGCQAIPWSGDWLNETEYFHSVHQNTTATSTLDTQYVYNQTQMNITSGIGIRLESVDIAQSCQGVLYGPVHQISGVIGGESLAYDGEHIWAGRFYNSTNYLYTYYENGTEISHTSINDICNGSNSSYLSGLSWDGTNLLLACDHPGGAYPSSDSRILFVSPDALSVVSSFPTIDEGVWSVAYDSDTNTIWYVGSGWYSNQYAYHTYANGSQISNFSLTPSGGLGLTYRHPYLYTGDDGGIREYKTNGTPTGNFYVTGSLPGSHTAVAFVGNSLWFKYATAGTPYWMNSTWLDVRSTGVLSLPLCNYNSFSGDYLNETVGNFTQDTDSISYVNGLAYIKRPISISNSLATNFTNINVSEWNTRTSWTCDDTNINITGSSYTTPWRCFKNNVIVNSTSEENHTQDVSVQDYILPTDTDLHITADVYVNNTDDAVSYSNVRYLNGLLDATIDIQNNTEMLVHPTGTSSLTATKTTYKGTGCSDWLTDTDVYTYSTNFANGNITGLRFKFNKGSTWSGYQGYVCNKSTADCDFSTSCQLGEWAGIGMGVGGDYLLHSGAPAGFDFEHLSDLQYAVTYSATSGGGSTQGGGGGGGSVVSCPEGMYYDQSTQQCRRGTLNISPAKVTGNASQGEVKTELIVIKNIGSIRTSVKLVPSISGILIIPSEFELDAGEEKQIELRASIPLTATQFQEGMDIYQDGAYFATIPVTYSISSENTWEKQLQPLLGMPPGTLHSMTALLLADSFGVGMRTGAIAGVLLLAFGMYNWKKRHKLALVLFSFAFIIVLLMGGRILL